MSKDIVNEIVSNLEDVYGIDAVNDPDIMSRAKALADSVKHRQNSLTGVKVTIHARMGDGSVMVREMEYDRMSIEEEKENFHCSDAITCSPDGPRQWMVPGTRGRAIIKLWKGCESYESFKGGR